PKPAPPVRKVNPILPWVGAAAALALLVVAGSLAFRGRNKPASILGNPTSHLTTQEGRESSPSLSPNGDRVVYTKASPTGKSDIYLQRGVDSPQNLTAARFAENCSEPAFSPDGTNVAF